MADPKQPVTPNTASVGYSTRLVTITAITDDGSTAICVDKNGTEARVPMRIQRSKGTLPAAGEQWIISQDISAGWSFAAIASTTDAPFAPATPPPPAPGSIPGSAIAPGSLTGTELAAQSISALNLAANAAGTNIILDPQFSSPAVNAVRLADPATSCPWTLTPPNAAVAGGAAACVLALMPSTLVPLYVNPGEQYYLSVGVTMPAGAAPGTSAGIQFAFSGGSFLGPVLPVAGGTQTVAQLVTIPAAVTSAYVRLVVTGLPSGVVATFTNPVCYITAGPNQLQAGSVGNAALQAGAVTATSLAAGSVTANAIAANAVDASKIVANSITAAQIMAGSVTADRLAANSIGVGQLVANLVYAHIVDATTVTGATLQNSTTNPRTSVNSDGSISITNASGIVIFKIGPDGTIYWYNSAGVLLMTLQPGGTQLIYASPTGPVAPSNEPPQPALLFAVTSTASAATYANATGAAVATGTVVTVVASCNSATTIASGVADSKGNTYTLLQSQASVSPTQQVFQSVITTPLTAADTISVTYSATNTLGKNIIATATSGVQAVPLDYSAQANGTGTAPSVAGTPTAYGDTVLMIVSNGGTAGPSAVPDGWQLTAQTSAAGTQTTSIYYSTNLASSGALTASATLPSSLNWTAVTLGYLVAPAQPFAAFAPVPSNASLSTSTLWADQGNFSVRVTKTGAAASWGVTYPAFTVTPGEAVAIRVVIATNNIALAALQTGVTFWSGPNGTGSNLGRWWVTWGTLALNGFFPLVMYNSYAPSNAVSATLDVTENQADTAGNWFLLDGVHVPGGLAFSNSPVATVDQLGNPVPQGINFYGLPGVTNVFGISDAYLDTQLASIDGYGNVTGQVISANTDMRLGGYSLLNDILPNYSLGVVTRGWVATAGNWPATPIGNTETSVLELDFVIPAGRQYLIQLLQATFIPSVAANGQMIQRLKYTTNGATPTTASTEVAGHSPGVQAVGTAQSGLNMPTPYMEWMPAIPASDTSYRMLVTASITGAGNTFQYATASESLELRVTDMGNNAPVNNGVTLGTGTGGGTGAQTYTEYFYGNTTWSYWEYGVRNHNGTIYQGAYSGEGYAQYAFIQFSQGSRGNNLNTVLNYTVNKVTFRLLNSHSWYNSGMTVSLHSSQSSGSNIGAISGELQSWHINEGQMLTTTLTAGAWAPFKAGGTTYAVIRPPGGSLSLDYYGYFWGGGTNNANVPMLAVTYTH